MATTTIAGIVSPASNRNTAPNRPGSFKSKPNVWQCKASSAPSRQAVALSAEKRPQANVSNNGKFAGSSKDDTTVEFHRESESGSDSKRRLSLKDYFAQSKELVGSSDGGPPRWFSPLECGSRLDNSPLLLYMPGIDGNGLGLILQQQRLGEVFDIWCLHIPLSDRTPFTDLVKLVEKTVRSENRRSPKRPIYLVGESVGGCLAIVVAAQNPNVDIVLILANPATCFDKSQLRPLLPLLEVMPSQLLLSIPYMLSLMTGIPPRMVMAIVEKGLPLQETVGEIVKSFTELSAYLSVLADGLPVETLLWKLKLLKSASAYANSRILAVRAQTLLLSSGRDQLLPSQEEGKRLHQVLAKCEFRRFGDSGHSLFLEDGVDLVSVIKGASFYRRSRYLDYVSDYLPPSPSDFKRVYESVRLTELATGPVMLSTLENGSIVRGLDGIPSDGPVLLVGYHMLLGLEIYPLVTRFWIERNILLRGIAHPMTFRKLREGRLPELSNFDTFRTMGAVPVSATNLYRLLALKSHVLLYPGGMREALHRKGEEYKLFWPKQSEFVRMAARFGAKIIPFGVVGEDDIGQLLFDYEDQMRIPYLKSFIDDITNEAVKLRTESEGEVTNQDVHLPGIFPKIPGRFYFLFGKPIETEGRKQELRSKEKSQELYLEVQSQVERCIAYLKEKRENDPYRNILPRLIYQATHGFESEVPTFEI